MVPEWEAAVKLKFTKKTITFIGILAGGIGFSLYTANRAYNLIEPSLASLGRTTTSYLSTWNCKKTHELLSELTVHRMRAEGNSAHSHGDTIPIADVIYGTYNGNTNLISDFHSLVPASTQSAALLQKYLAHNTNKLQAPHSHSSQAKHGATHEASAPMHSGHSTESLGRGPIINSPNAYLQQHACEQLKHGLPPRNVYIYKIPFEEFQELAQDPRPTDTWILFAYPYGNKMYSFALSKINPSYVEIAGEKRPLNTLLPQGTGSLKVDVTFAPITALATSAKIVQAFPFIHVNTAEEIGSNKILPFKNQVYSIGSAISESDIDRAALGASLPFALFGSLLTLLIAALAYRLQSDMEARHNNLESESRTDALTKIANRRHWDETIKRCEIDRLQSNIGFHVAIIDLNGFKALNDQFGHEYGDQVIQKTAATLTSILRADTTDFTARLGGDEFGMIFKAMGVESDVIQERIETALKNADLQAAVGIGTTSKQKSLNDAWSQADKKMYSNKKR